MDGSKRSGDHQERCRGTMPCSSLQLEGLACGVEISHIFVDAGATNPPKPGTRPENAKESKEARNSNGSPSVARSSWVGRKVFCAASVRLS